MDYFEAWFTEHRHELSADAEYRSDELEMAYWAGYDQRAEDE